MKRYFSAGLLLALAASVSFAQVNGFGVSGAAGPTFQGGDPAELTKRILSSTRYKLTPGDVYQLSVTMGTLTSYPLILQENYDLDVPYMGTLNVKGLYFADLRKMITEKMKKLLPLAEFVSLALQSPARFDVEIFGGVEAPGIVTVYPLARVSDAITLAKGFKKGVASYRQVSLIRGGARIRVDLMRYASDAAGEQNPYLEPGDRIYVPQAEVVVTLAGQVKFPGPFELIHGETLRDLIAYAGGTLPDARAGEVELVRFEAGGRTTQKILDLAAAAETVLENGDRVRVPSVVENREMILVTGGFFGAPVASDRPVQIPPAPITMNVPFSPGISLLTVLEAIGGPTPYARAKEGLLVRKRTGERMPVDLEALWASKDPARDIALEPGDMVTLPVVTDVFVSGEVRNPGRVPFNPSLTVGDYLLLSGGILPDSADPKGIWFVDLKGNRAKADTGSKVEPGALILVDQNGWAATQKTFANVTAVTGFVAAVITAAATVVSFVKMFTPP